MYCKRCGTELPMTGSFCPNCGAPVSPVYTNRVPPTPVPPPRGPEDVFLGAVTAVLFGLSTIGGGVYSIVELTRYTRWAIPCGLSAVLAGTSCTVKGLCQLLRMMNTKRRNDNER